MTSALSAAARSFLRVFIAALLVFAPGILAAPNLNRMYDLGVAAILASFAAVLRAVSAYVPKLSLVPYLGHPFGDWGDSFLHAFLASLIVTLIGVLGAPDLNTARSLFVAGIIGAFNVALRALQGVGTQGEQPLPNVGFPAPRVSYTYAVTTRRGGAAPIGTPAATLNSPPGS